MIRCDACGLIKPLKGSHEIGPDVFCAECWPTILPFLEGDAQGTLPVDAFDKPVTAESE